MQSKNDQLVGGTFPRRWIDGTDKMSNDVPVGAYRTYV